jgi:hypothetical protein
VHVGGAHTDEQLGHADVGEAGHFEHVGQHPGLTEERVMCRRSCTPDGETLESFEEDALCRCREAPATAGHRDPTIRPEHAPDF